MKYFSGYKYVLAEDMVFQVSICPKEDIVTDLIHLTTTGLLTVKKWYPWDGASGPAMDTYSKFEASCCHDALYELMRKGKLPHGFWEAADVEYLKLMEANGAWRLTIWMDALGLKLAGGTYARPSKRKRIHDTKNPRYLDKRRKL